MPRKLARRDLNAALWFDVPPPLPMPRIKRAHRARLTVPATARCRECFRIRAAELVAAGLCVECQ